MFGGLAKWVAQIDSAERVPEYLYRAFTTATSGRPGPVVLALPEDMLADEVEADGRAAVRAGAGPPGRGRPRAPARAARRREAAVRDRRRRRLDRRRPRRTSSPSPRRTSSPSAPSFRRQDYVDNASRVYAGHVGIGPDPKLAARVRDADLLLVVGARLGESTTGGYTLVEPGRTRQTLVHVHAAAEELGRVYQPALGIVSGSPQFAAAARALEPVDSSAWRAETEQAHADHLASLQHTPGPGDARRWAR